MMAFFDLADQSGDTMITRKKWKEVMESNLEAEMVAWYCCKGPMVQFFFLRSSMLVVWIWLASIQSGRSYRNSFHPIVALFLFRICEKSSTRLSQSQWPLKLNTTCLIECGQPWSGMIILIRYTRFVSNCIFFHSALNNTRYLQFFSGKCTQFTSSTFQSSRSKYQAMVCGAGFVHPRSRWSFYPFGCWW